MTILVVGSVALDTIKTPFGKVEDSLGGSATFFSLAASFYNNINLVAVVGKDIPQEGIKLLESKNVDLNGLQIKDGETFRWGGEYGHDLNQRETLFTHLNVFEDFKPVIPEEYRQSTHIFLANIDPDLQLEVLEQIENPKLVACDTMNFWIERKKDVLLKLFGKINILIINDEEACQLSENPNLVYSAKWLIDKGPQTVIIKKGENGAIMFNDGAFFWAPAYPLENIVDPTGAGDTFAGGLVGYLSKLDEVTASDLRQSVIAGSVFASFCVEKFGVSRLAEISEVDLISRFNQFKDLTSFELTNII